MTQKPRHPKEKRGAVKPPAMIEPDRPGQARLNDVADRAGVSIATVSRFVNNTAFVAPATAERIRKAIEELSYIPNLLAGGLASARTRLVAILVPHLAYSIVNEMVEDMVEQLTSEGIVVMLGLTGTDPVRTNEILMAAMGRRVDAIITTGIVTEPARSMLRRNKITVIEVWDLPKDPVDAAIGFSHYEAGREIAQFLKTRGYMRPHIITAQGSRASQRRDGFVEAWTKGGGAKPTEDEVEIPSGFGHARRAFAVMQRLTKKPDVAVCASDFLAQGLIVEAMTNGLSVPKDLAVIGFGNSRIASEMRPTISSVEVDGARIAREVIRILKARAEPGGETETRIDVGFRIIARESA